LSALAAPQTRSLGGWRRWRVTKAAGATADALRTRLSGRIFQREAVLAVRGGGRLPLGGTPHPCRARGLPV
jgi:hypothetical protein